MATGKGTIGVHLITAADLPLRWMHLKIKVS
jgi:hypothetical protein